MMNRVVHKNTDIKELKQIRNLEMSIEEKKTGADE